MRHQVSALRLIGFLSVFLAVCSLSPLLVSANAEEPPKGWHGSGALGLSMTRGNSDTLLFNLNAQLQNDISKSDIAKLGANYTFGQQKIDGVRKTTASVFQAYGEYDRLFSERLYGVLRADVFHDDIASLRYRLILGPALGYYFIKNDTTKLSGEVGPSIVFQEQAGDSNDYIALRLSERFEHAFSKTWKVWQSADFFPQIDEFDNYLLVAEIGTEAALNSKLSLRVTLQDRYNNEAPLGKKKNDVMLITALVYKF